MTFIQRRWHQNLRQRVRALVKKIFPCRKGGPVGGNKAGSVERKVAAGRKYRRRDKPSPNNIWSYWERPKHMQPIRALGPIPHRRAPVICAGFALLSTAKPIRQCDTTQPVFPSFLVFFTDIWQDSINDRPANRKNINTLKKCMHLRKWESNSRSHYQPVHVSNSTSTVTDKLVVKSKVHPCTGTEALYRPYGP